MQRRAHRHPTRSAIILTSRGMGRHFTVTNVSKSGAGITGEKPLRIGEGVILNYAGGRIDAVVKWAHQTNAGVAFSRDLADEDLSLLIDPAYITPDLPEHQLPN